MTDQTRARQRTGALNTHANHTKEPGRGRGGGSDAAGARDTSPTRVRSSRVKGPKYEVRRRRWRKRWVEEEE